MTTATTMGLSELVERADCAWPDEQDSRDFLYGIHDACLEQLQYKTPYWQDMASEIADNAVPVYTHQRWRMFVDLGAYNEDLTDFGGPVANMTENAGVALYIIAERLAYSILSDLYSFEDE